MKSPEVIAGVPAGYLNTEQVCQLTGLSYETVRRATKRGELVAVRIAGRLLYPIAKLPGHDPAPTAPAQKPRRTRDPIDAQIDALVNSRG